MSWEKGLMRSPCKEQKLAALELKKMVLVLTVTELEI
jgi:hypothetical protein